MFPKPMCVAVLVLILGGIPSLGASAEDDVVEPRSAASQTELSRRAHALAGDVMSPFCPGRTLADCPSPSAGEWREEIRAWVAEGLSDQQIKDRLQARVPEVDLSFTPRSKLGWALPGLILVLGLGLVAVALRRAVRPTRPEELDAPVDPELRAEIERALDEASR